MLFILEYEFQYFTEVEKNAETKQSSTTQQDILTQFVMNATSNLIPNVDAEVIRVFIFFVVLYFSSINLISPKRGHA